MAGESNSIQSEPTLVDIPTPQELGRQKAALQESSAPYTEAAGDIYAPYADTKQANILPNTGNAQPQHMEFCGYEYAGDHQKHAVYRSFVDRDFEGRINNKYYNVKKGDAYFIKYPIMESVPYSDVLVPSQDAISGGAYSGDFVVASATTPEDLGTLYRINNKYVHVPGWEQEATIFSNKGELLLTHNGATPYDGTIDVTQRYDGLIDVVESPMSDTAFSVDQEVMSRGPRIISAQGFEVPIEMVERPPAIERMTILQPRMPAAPMISGGLAVLGGVAQCLATHFIIQKLEKGGELGWYNELAIGLGVNLPAIPAGIVLEQKALSLVSAPKVQLTRASIGVSFGAGVAASLPVTPTVSYVLNKLDVNLDSTGGVVLQTALVGALVLAAISAVPAGLGIAATLGTALGIGALAAAGFGAAASATHEIDKKVGISDWLAKEAEESLYATAALVLGIWTRDPVLIGIWALDHLTEPANMEVDETSGDA